MDILGSIKQKWATVDKLKLSALCACAVVIASLGVFGAFYSLEFWIGVCSALLGAVAFVIVI